jgi:hypothetical protein
VSGKTGEQVNDTKSGPPPQHAEFYDERRESEENAPEQGGSVSPVQMAENQPLPPGGAAASDEDAASKKRTDADGGYFRKRDYEPS